MVATQDMVVRIRAEIDEESIEKATATLKRLAGDWTALDGRSNSSLEFLQLVGEVERLIRGDAHALLAGHAESTARLIVAQLAHVHGLVPLRPIISIEVEEDATAEG